MRSANEFMQRAFRTAGELHGGNYKAAVMLLAIAQAADGHWIDETVRRAIFRPVSVRALATSLFIPYETMRRSVGELVSAGLCVHIGREGVVVCSDAQTQAAVEKLHEVLAELFLQVLRELKSIKFCFDRFEQEIESIAVPGQVQFTADCTRDTLALSHSRAASDLFLRLIEAAGPAHSHHLVLTAVFAAIVAANQAAITHDRAAAWRYASEDSPVPDDLRVPVSVHTVALMLGMPVETTRRYVTLLIHEDKCRRIEGKGVVVPMSAECRPGISRTETLLALRFTQTLSELKRRRFDFGALVTFPDQTTAV